MRRYFSIHRFLSMTHFPLTWGASIRYLEPVTTYRLHVIPHFPLHFRRYVHRYNLYKPKKGLILARWTPSNIKTKQLLLRSQCRCVLRKAVVTVPKLTPVHGLPGGLCVFLCRETGKQVAPGALRDLSSGAGPPPLPAGYRGLSRGLRHQGAPQRPPRLLCFSDPCFRITQTKRSYAWMERVLFMHSACHRHFQRQRKPPLLLFYSPGTAVSSARAPLCLG